MPCYKVTYFNVRARAELTRLVFAAAGQEFEDIRVDREAWQKMKPSVLTGQLPMLEVDGKVVNQSSCMARYLAKEFGLLGKTNMDAAQIETIVECCNDLRDQMTKAFFFEKDETKKEELKKEMVETHYPKFLGLLDKILDANGGDYLYGKELTLADLAVVDLLEGATERFSCSLAEHPKVAAHKKRIEELPKIAEWLKKRPKTDF
ncbi:hypothetical protein ScPMuIL_008623 [Solemya velum]